MAHENDAPDRQDADRAREILATDFVATVIDAEADAVRDTLDPQWWSESADGRCSEHAALFAASQPAPLNVV